MFCLFGCHLEKESRFDYAPKSYIIAKAEREFISPFKEDIIKALQRLEEKRIIYEKPEGYYQVVKSNKIPLK